MTSLARVPPKLLNAHKRIVGKQHLLTLVHIAEPSANACCAPRAAMISVSTTSSGAKHEIPYEDNPRLEELLAASGWLV